MEDPMGNIVALAIGGMCAVVLIGGAFWLSHAIGRWKAPEADQSKDKTEK